MNNNDEPQQVITPKTASAPLKLTLLAILLWFGSLGLPAFVNFGTNDSMLGFWVLFSGWLGPLAANLAWFANIFWFIAVLKVGVERPATTVAA